MRITKAEPSEAKELTEIATAAKRSWDYPEKWIDLWRPLLTITPDSIAAHETYAARSNGRLIGFYALVRNDDILCLEHLWVRPEEMGRGVGRSLFRHAGQKARELGFATFEIESDPNAAGFYERMGAERMGTNRTMLDNQHRDLPIFRCRIDRADGDLAEQAGA